MPEKRKAPDAVQGTEGKESNHMKETDPMNNPNPTAADVLNAAKSQEWGSITATHVAVLLGNKTLDSNELFPLLEGAK